MRLYPPLVARMHRALTGRQFLDAGKTRPPPAVRRIEEKRSDEAKIWIRATGERDKVFCIGKENAYSMKRGHEARLRTSRVAQDTHEVMASIDEHRDISAPTFANPTRHGIDAEFTWRRGIGFNTIPATTEHEAHAVRQSLDSGTTTMQQNETTPRDEFGPLLAHALAKLRSAPCLLAITRRPPQSEKAHGAVKPTLLG
jgi:hypothetical protein